MESPKRPQLLRIGDLKRTQDQVRVLMQIADSCETLLAKQVEIGTTVEFDGAAAEAASQTYCLAHAQLRNLIDDQPRWGMNSTEGDRVVERLAAANLEVAKQQKHNLIEFSRPSRLYGARVGQFQLKGQPGLVWIAWMGGEAPTANGLVGTGVSAEAALIAFDVAFSKSIEQPAPASGPAKKPRTTRKKS